MKYFAPKFAISGNGGIIISFFQWLLTVKILNIGTYVRANSVDSDQTALKEQSDQDLHCLPFFLHLLEALLQCKIKLFYIKDNYGSWSGCPNI